MGHICVCIATLLLSLTAGMFLLAKTKKDSLGTFHSVISWFVIVLSLGCLLCCGMRAVMHGCCGMREEREIMMNGGEEGMQMCRPGMGGPHRMMRMEMRGGNCCGMNKECIENEMMEDACMQKEGEMKMGECCKKKMHCEKDSVIVKTK
jgi:hypothetical protein